MTIKEASLLEVGVFRDECKPSPSRVFPNILVRFSEQAAFADMHTARKMRHQ